MNSYSALIEVNEDELKNIFEELTKAQETIYKCYDRLKDLGVVKFQKENRQS